MDLDKGGRGAIERMVEAYGFTTRQALCEKLGISKSTLATRYMRDSFPSDWVIQCSLETGSSLRWLTTGEGPSFENYLTDIIEIPKKKLIDGELFNSGFYYFDKALINNKFNTPIIVIENEHTFIAESTNKEINDGKWIISIDGKLSIRSIYRLPNNRVKVESEDFSFESDMNDIGFELYLRTVIASLK